MATLTSTAAKAKTTLFNVEIPHNLVLDGPRLLNKDRCEYSMCGQAYVRFVHPTSGIELLMCGNHAKRNVAKMIEESWMIDDQTSELFQDNRHKGEL